MPDDVQPASHTISLTLHNPRQTAQWLVLEPWGQLANRWRLWMATRPSPSGAGRVVSSRFSRMESS